MDEIEIMEEEVEIWKEEIKNLRLNNKQLYDALEEADITICALCKRLNPQHEECTMCVDREYITEVLKECKE
jgi:hypothetical protein